MVLYGALTDAEVVSDDLVRTPLNHEVQDVAFARRQTGEALGRRATPFGSLSQIPHRSSARSMLARSSSGRTGFSRNRRRRPSSPGPPSRCRRPVIMIAGSSRFSAFSRSSSAIPSMPGIRASTSRHPGPFVGRARGMPRRAYVSAVWPCARSNACMLSRTARSSSTTKIMGCATLVAVVACRALPSAPRRGLAARKLWICCISVSALVGLLRCTQPAVKILFKVSVEISPVRRRVFRSPATGATA